MGQSRRRRLTNVTVQVDADDLTWARMRALFAGTSVNSLIRNFLEEYAAVPDRFRAGEPPPWSDTGLARDAFAQVVDPRGAGARARDATPGGVSRPIGPRQR
jgi:hypothetical protein